jgi:hypothetical protein
MGCDKLRIQQTITADTQPRNKVGKRNLRRIPHAGHHAFTKKSPAQRYTIKPTDKLVILPTLNRVGKPCFMQRAVSF